MKVSLAELQGQFAKPLPGVDAVADAFTFHAFEIDSVDGDTLDVKVLPNRAADCSTVAGIARELSAILDLPLKDVAAPDYAGQPTIAITLGGLSAVLGVALARDEVLDVFRRLAFRVESDGETIRVTAPAPRADVAILEDVAEEVGQVLGYDRIASAELAPIPGTPDQARFRGVEKAKDVLVAQGFTEISTQSFAKKGDITLANPLDKTKPALRTTLAKNMEAALALAKQYAPLLWAPGEKPKLFEIGNVFTKDGEQLVLETSEPVADVPKIEDDNAYEPKRYTLGAYQPFSVYPFMLRDIAVWTPRGTEAAAVEALIRQHAGVLLVRLDQFDSFEKDGRISHAFRLVFESGERTLTDEEINGVMEKVTAALNAQPGFEVR